MYRKGQGEFKFFVGVGSLAQIATREDRVCVLNILGGESREVTPTGHVYSGGNVVFGTAPGKRGQRLATAAGDVPVYNNVLEGLADGHRFNCGVVYLPPAAARDGVAELIRVNPELRKIFIVTEKLSVSDSRDIRAMGQANGIDIFGGNSLGVADAWNEVRIGGALGGDRPADALRRGSIALLSNSGGFTTTIATYLRMAGWGTTTAISSGKDVYIQYAAPEFAFALANDARSKAAVLYVEPGGFYELDADFTKPVVACVVGRWKSRLTRAVGHAGALAGGSDDAAAKERWFMDKFGVDAVFTPDDPVHSARGAVVTNIAHIAAALTAVMRENGCRPDFEAEGSLSLKPWFSRQDGLALPESLRLPRVVAAAPYDAQIAALDAQVGVVRPRQSMKDASGVSRLDPATQVASLHGVSMLSAAQLPFEGNVFLALLHERGGPGEHALVDVAVGAAMALHGRPALAAAQAAREAGNAPNAVLAAALCVTGPRDQAGARKAVRQLVDAFHDTGLDDAFDAGFDVGQVTAPAEAAFFATMPDPQAERLLAALDARGIAPVMLRWLCAQDRPLRADAVLGAISATLAWRPLRLKRISRMTAESLPWWLQLCGTLLGAAAGAERHAADRFCDESIDALLRERTLGELAFTALVGQPPVADELRTFAMLAGLLLTNGPGTISAQGAKGAVSADGPEDPARVQLNKCLVGFLTHSGFAHGGNGFEGIQFLLEQFDGSGLVDPGDPGHGIDVPALARRCATQYAAYKSDRRQAGSLDLRKIPGVNHPVFKDLPVNVDPREQYVSRLLAAHGDYNVFLEFYRALVLALHEAGVSRTVYCVNVDAVIAALLLKMLWKPYRCGALDAGALEAAAFTIFLFPRMLGCAAEIDDHLDRGRNMDTRTPASACRFVA